MPRPSNRNQWRRPWRLFSSRLVLLLWAWPALVQAQFNYTTNNSTITITGYTGPGGVVVTIPASITGLPVTRIGDRAFYQCYGLTSVTIPNSVISIGDWAFSGCDGLTNVTIPNSVISIADYAFANCGLTSVTIPNSVTDLGGAAFQSCISLTSVIIGNGVSRIVPVVWLNTEIGTWVEEGTFEYCNGLTNIVIGNSVTTIGNRAFKGCGLTSVTIPSTVTTIGDLAFTVCPSLTNVTIPNSVTSIGNWAFSDCLSLTAVTVEVNNPAYSSVDGILLNKNQTTLLQYPAGKVGGQYTIPNSVTSIADYAFANCGLTSVTIPNSVTDLGGAAFAGCASLTSVTIGNGVSRIVPGWIGIVGGLQHYFTVALGTFEGCTSLTNITIPSSVTTIGDQAFSGCTSLTNVTIPNSVTTIGDQAFYYCTSLAGVYFQGNAPSLGYSLFSGTTNATVFYLPGTTGWGPTFGDCPTALWFLPYPLILNNGPSFGVQTNGFGFIISWATNGAVVVEATTTLVNPTWNPVSTNTLNNGSSYFNDPEWSNCPNRFYRLRSP